MFYHTLKHLASLCFLVALLALGACGDTVSVPSGTVARQMTTNGLEGKIYQPGAYRLDACPFSSCPQMVILETGLNAEEIAVGTVFLPKSNVDLSDVKLALQFRVRPTADAVNRIYKEVTSAATEHHDYRKITADMLYKIYLQRLIPNVMIAVLRDYTVEEVLANVDHISVATLNRIKAEMGDQPVEVTEVGFPNGIGKPPEQVLEAKRNLYVVAENITRRVRELEGQLRVEQQRQFVQQLRVNNDVANAKAAGLDIGDYIYLKNMERFADEHVPLGLVPSLGTFTEHTK